MPHKKLNYEVVYRPIKYPRIELKTGKIVVILPEGYDPEQVLQKHNRWVQDKLKIINQAIRAAENETLLDRSRTELREIVEKLARNYEKELGININKIFLRRMKTKWASCSSKRNLTINELTKHLPERLLGYIIYHELIHLFEKRHNDKFWWLVSKKYPDYPELERQLLAYWFLIRSRRDQTASDKR